MSGISSTLVLNRESGDGADEESIILNPKSLPANKNTDVNFYSKSNIKNIDQNKKIQIITKCIQNIWLRRNSTQPKLTNRLIDLEEQKKQFISLPTTFLSTKLIQVIPHQAFELRKTTKQNSNLKAKFVPYEPYKAALAPMIFKKIKKKVETKRITKIQQHNKDTNIDLNTLISQISSVKANEIKNDNKTVHYEKKIDLLQKEKAEVEKKLQFQVKYNAELKNLLVNALSQDETFVRDRITSMTEDKLQLAQKLLSSVEDLSNRTDMIDYYSGQIEVWRSRFLASGVMIEELARWKTSLFQKNQLLINSNKQLLAIIGACRDMQIKILSNLAFLDEKGKKLELQTANLIDISKENLALSEHLALQNTSKIGIPSALNLEGLEMMTEIEKFVYHSLESSNESSTSTDLLLNSILSQNYLTIKQEKKTNAKNPDYKEFEE